MGWWQENRANIFFATKTVHFGGEKSILKKSCHQSSERPKKDCVLPMFRGRFPIIYQSGWREFIFLIIFATMLFFDLLKGCSPLYQTLLIVVSELKFYSFSK